MFADALQEYIPLLLHAAVRSFVVFVIALGVVYVVGRMLELVNSNRGRNAVALLAIVPASYFSTLIYDMSVLVHPWEFYWRVTVYSAGAALLFVLLGWRLFDRIDHLLDKKVAPDQGNPETSKTSKKSRSK